jgi:hypothetical protein
MMVDLNTTTDIDLDEINRSTTKSIMLSNDNVNMLES